MSESLWAATAEELLGETASSKPTPGGGSIAAITGAFGVGLVQMAVAVTADAALEPQATQLAALQEAIVPAADGDVQDFTALMSAYRLPRGDDAEREARARAVETACIAATERPLALVASLARASALSHELEPLVNAGIRSDVLAGRDIVAGAARAALHTADINLRELDRLVSPAAPELHARRDALAASLGEAS